MIRDLTEKLIQWKTDSLRKPLLIRGARQVGKSWLVREFGKENFENLVEINFELRPELKSCFEKPDPSGIIQTLEVILSVDIIPGKILLFIDEIQEQPMAIKALRYFYELLPELHVIAAGSLLEFAGEAENFSSPVGRIQNYFLNPMSFGEFLTASGEVKFRVYLKELKITESIPDSLFQKGRTLLKQYLYTGGMPETVKDYIDTGSFQRINEIHMTLLQNYRQDFGKYGRKVKYEHLEAVFSHITGTVGSKLKYSKVSTEIAGRELKKALDLLNKAQVVQKIILSSGTGIPLKAHVKENHFKVQFLDVGLMQSDMGINKETFLSEDILATYHGAVAEQYVGQQLMALQPNYMSPELFFWQRENRSSNAEVDFLYQTGSTILPVEVKSGKTGTLKSLRIFLDEKKAPFGVRFSMHPLSYTDKLLSIPLFAVEALPSLIDQIKGL